MEIGEREKKKERQVERDSNEYLHFELFSGVLRAQLVSHQALQEADGGGGADHVHHAAP